MKIRTEVMVDLVQPSPLPIVKAKQGDSNREVAVTLVASGVIAIPDTDPKIYIKKPDGTKVYNNCTIEGQKVIVPLTNQSLAVAGEAEAEIQIVDSTGTLTTPIFRLVVYSTNIDGSAIESSDEFGALVTSLAEVEELKKNGLKGDTGTAATIEIGTTTTLAAGSKATVENTGTSGAAVLNFGIPKGDKGDTGSVEVATDGNVTYTAASSYTAPASGITLGTWLGRVHKAVVDGRAGTTDNITYTTPSSYTAPASGITLKTFMGRVTRGLADAFTSLASKIESSKILSETEWAAVISERGYLADAKDIKDSVDSIYTKFDPAVVSQTSTPTYASNVSGAAMSLRRYGKTVSLSFSLQINATFSAEQTIFTIPSGYRPQGSTYFVVQIAGGNDSNAGRITTNGVFTLPNNTITKGSYLVGSVTYICA